MLPLQNAGGIGAQKALLLKASAEELAAIGFG